MPISGNKAALSNLGTSLVGASERTSFQILTNARNARDSGQNPFLEHDRIREIRKLPPEETFDLVTDSHHFIANGVVVHNCDIRINNDLLREGYTFEGTSPCVDDRFGKDVPEEEIYNQLVEDKGNGIPTPESGDLEGDMDEAPPTEAEIIQQVQAVSKAIQQAKMCKGAGKIPGGIEDWIQEFLEPVIPWEQVLYQWFVDRSSDDYSWSRPNRRYQDVYLPSMTNSFNQLTKLNYYVDVSGSITREQIIRFNSELKYIKEQFNPEELRVVMFDTEIQEEYVFTDNDTFDRIKVTAGGGTSLVPVREHIINTQPTATIVFSDLEVEPMQPLPIEIPIIWACVENPSALVPFGTLIHIKEPKK